MTRKTMHLILGNDCAVTVHEPPLPLTPRFSLSGEYVTVSPHTDQPTHETLLSETFGSVDWLWSGDDEFRFAAADRGLRGVILTVPETLATDAESDRMRSWGRAPRVPGNVRAVDSRHFDARPTRVRWVSETGDQVVCAYESGAGGASQDVLRLRSAPCFDLVFVDRALSGWILDRPADFLVQEWEYAPSRPAPDGVADVLRDCLGTFGEATIGRMQDGEAAAPEVLRSLRARAPTCRRTPVATCCATSWAGSWRAGVTRLPAESRRAGRPSAAVPARPRFDLRHPRGTLYGSIGQA
ncbi:hypothetical protein CG723_20340 [Streptomyces sp. CB01635]|nr:hypothetical protein CG723_20340 [Streptomyces sp. CB01635]